jgi:predicted dehydrogenase
MSSSKSKRVKIGLYGSNGHQIQNALVNHSKAELVAVGGWGDGDLPAGLENVKRYDSLDELLADDAVELVSLCSPLRSEQGGHAVACMKAGKHVYAEKPCAMTEEDLDEIIAISRETGMIFHEMAGTVFDQPYCTLREIVASGVIGEVIQVFSQKSYPWADWRPGDERIDGGLALQVGVYNARFTEHVAGVKIKTISSRETLLGNDVPNSQCHRAVSFLMELENGGVASAVANYCCPASPGWKKWGYETVRIFGTEGFVESIDSGRIGTLAVNGREPETLDFSKPTRDYLDMVLEEVATGTKVIPFNLEDEISPTLWVIRAKHLPTTQMCHRWISRQGKKTTQK